jgi:hypothetical protein
MVTIKKNIETVTDASKEVDEPVITKKTTKYMLLSRHQNAGQNHDMKTANKIVSKFTTVSIHGNDSNKSEFGSGGNQEETEF